MTAQIEFFDGIKENVLPIIKLTKSKNGKTGTATFLFFNPKSFKKTKFDLIPLQKISLIWKKNKITTNNLSLFFRKGKPQIIKALFLFKNSKEWFEFLSFMSYYAKETALSFSEKDSII